MIAKYKERTLYRFGSLERTVVHADTTLSTLLKFIILIKNQCITFYLTRYALIK